MEVPVARRRRRPEPSESGVHYDKVAEKYHQSFFYDKNTPFEAWQLRVVREALDLHESSRLLDLGGGTGRFSSLLRSSVSTNEDTEFQVTCVDPSKRMLDVARAIKGVVAVENGAFFLLSSLLRSDSQHHHTDALTYCREFALLDARTNEKHTHVLLKEILHHLETPFQVAELFGYLKNGVVEPGGRVVVVTRPKKEVDYPFFQKAYDVWVSAQPDAEEWAASLRSKGFLDVSIATHSFDVELELDVWCDMIRNRFWSTFAGFSDEEIETGISEIREGSTSSTVNFEERAVLLTATAPGTIE